MFVYKNIDKSGTSIDKSVVHYSHNLNTGSAGFSSIHYISGSVSESHWKSLNALFYTSGSPTYTGESKFYYNSSNFTLNGQFLSKFHGYVSGSILSISQKHFGEKIKPGSFKLTNNSYTDKDGNSPIIKDDKFGNLYSTNAIHSQSITSISSSDNYVGNIFYDMGLVVITETGSWSGSVNYSDIGENHNTEFESTETIHTHQYSVTTNPNEFDYSMNYTLRCLPTTSEATYEEATGSAIIANPYLCAEFTSSDWQPYVTAIALYNENEFNEPVIVAHLPRPIMKSKKVAITYKIRLDI
jgi:hypothetical protein